MDKGAWWAAVHGVTCLRCVHEGGGRWVGSNKLVELKKKKERTKINLVTKRESEWGRDKLQLGD